MSQNHSTLPLSSFGNTSRSIGRPFSPLSEGMRRQRRCVCCIQLFHEVPMTQVDKQIKDQIRKSVFQGLSDSQRKIRTSCVRVCRNNALVHLIHMVPRLSPSQKLRHATGQTNTPIYYPPFWGCYLLDLQTWFTERCACLLSSFATTYRKINYCP